MWQDQPENVPSSMVDTATLNAPAGDAPLPRIAAAFLVKFDNRKGSVNVWTSLQTELIRLRYTLSWHKSVDKRKLQYLLMHGIVADSADS